MSGVAVVSGPLANKPFNGGIAWVPLSYLRGLDRLGFATYFVEAIDSRHCTDENGRPVDPPISINANYFRRVVNDFDLGSRASLIFGDGPTTDGLSYSDVREVLASATILINISGHLESASLRNLAREVVYLDLDPGYTQFWHASGNDGARLEGHDHFFTVGTNIGRAESSIPVGGIQWIATRPPVVLEDWSHPPTRAHRGFTTVASWRGAFGPVEFEGVRYGQKVHEFRKFLSLPRITGRRFEIALDIHRSEEKDLTALETHGWEIEDPRRVAAYPQDFKDYVQDSTAEFSVAQAIYVETDSGWFSDRTVRYLASGKPALVQDTGWSRHYSFGEGLIPFRTLQEAAMGAESISEQYDLHAAAAKKIAADLFDSDKVISELLRASGI